MSSFSSRNQWNTCDKWKAGKRGGSGGHRDRRNEGPPTHTAAFGDRRGQEPEEAERLWELGPTRDKDVSSVNMWRWGNKKPTNVPGNSISRGATRSTDVSLQFHEDHFRDLSYRTHKIISLCHFKLVVIWQTRNRKLIQSPKCFKNSYLACLESSTKCQPLPEWGSHTQASLSEPELFPDCLGERSSPHQEASQ